MRSFSPAAFSSVIVILSSDMLNLPLDVALLEKNDFIGTTLFLTTHHVPDTVLYAVDVSSPAACAAVLYVSGDGVRHVPDINPPWTLEIQSAILSNDL